MMDEDLDSMTPDDLRAEVVRLRTGIRSHRDQRGDDRCWLDDVDLYALVPEGTKATTKLPPKDVFLANCARFHAHRQGESPRYLPVAAAPGHVAMTYEEASRQFSEMATLMARVTELQEQLTAETTRRRMWDRRTQVREFFVIAEQPIGERPHVPDEETVRFRLRLIAEEFFEMIEAAFGPVDAHHSRGGIKGAIDFLIGKAQLRIALPELVDAWADLDYVIEGARVAFGIDGGPIAWAVHKANLAKGRGPRREGDGKLLKPDGWRQPDVAGCLRAQGWEPPTDPGDDR